MTLQVYQQIIGSCMNRQHNRPVHVSFFYIVAWSVGNFEQSSQRDSDKLIEQLKEFEAYVKCMIGRNLFLLQKKKKKGAQFIKFVRKHMTSYSPSMIYFLMKLYNVTQDYNRLTLGIGELKTNFKLIAELVAEEPVYWKNLA